MSVCIIPHGTALIGPQELVAPEPCQAVTSQAHHVPLHSIGCPLLNECVVACGGASCHIMCCVCPLQELKRLRHEQRRSAWRLAKKLKNAQEQLALVQVGHLA